MHFTLRQLHAFVAVSNTGSFTRAADYLCLSPSAVSQLVGELESVLGYKLLERNTRKVALSPAGRVLIPSVQAVLRELEVVAMVATDIRDQAAGLVRVAAPMVIASTMLPPLIAAYRRAHPKSMVRVVDCPVESLVEKVASREVDLAIGPDRPVGREVERRVLYTSPWVVWCAPDHPLARLPSITWPDLGAYEMVAAGRDHEIHLAAIRRHIPEGAAVMPQQIVDNISTALGLAASGLCYTISPAYVEALALPLGLVMRRIEGPHLSREMSLFMPTDRSLSPAATRFAAYAEEALRRVRRRAAAARAVKSPRPPLEKVHNTL